MEALDLMAWGSNEMGEAGEHSAYLQGNIELTFRETLSLPLLDHRDGDLMAWGSSGMGGI